MEKSFNSRLTEEEQRKIKEKLYNDYTEFFKNIKVGENDGIDALDDIEICDLAEFLILMNPDKYADTPGNEMNYRNDEHLQKIYVLKNSNEIEGKNNNAILINTDEKGKIPKGEYGVYDFNEKEFRLAENARKEIVKRLGIGCFDHRKQDEIIKDVFGNELNQMDKFATMDLERFIEERGGQKKIEEARNKAIDEENRINGKSKEDEEITIGNQEEQKDKSGDNENKKGSSVEIPEDVKKACEKLGVTHIKSYFYVAAAQLDDKVDNTHTNKNQGKVLMLEIPDESRISGPNRYFGLQGEKLVLWGNEDEAVNRVVGPGTPKEGKYIEPLKENNPTMVEFNSSHGLSIKEEIKDQSDVSIQKKLEYKDEIEELLEKYVMNLEKIENSKMSAEQKQIELQKIDANFDINFDKITKESGINKNNVENVKLKQDRFSEEEQEEQEQEKENYSEDEYDDSGKLIPPGKRRIGE